MNPNCSITNLQSSINLSYSSDIGDPSSSPGPDNGPFIILLGLLSETHFFLFLSNFTDEAILESS